MKKFLIFSLTLLTLAGCSKQNDPVETAQKQEKIEIDHIHGLAFSQEDETLYAPVHDGVIFFKDKVWKIQTGPAYDFMGFTSTKKAFFSSGHPKPGSNEVNPLGLIRSTNFGKSWEKLGLQGESDFHLLNAGYNSGIIYAYSGTPNSKMASAGLHFTKDEGATWEKSGEKGVSGNPISMIAHPDKPGTLVYMTLDGIYISEDYGNNFQLLTSGVATTGAFSPDGKSLYLGKIDLEKSISTLVEYEFEGKKETPIETPQLNYQEVILNIAVHYMNPYHIAFATSDLNLHQTMDDAQSWETLVQDGEVY